MYLIVSNTDSSTYYSENKASHFFVKLGKPLDLSGCWKIALCEVTILGNTARRGTVGLTCNICNGLWVEGVQTRLLRKFKCEKNNHLVFPVPYYVDIEKLFIDTLEFHILSPKGKEVALAADVKVELTLHLIHDVSKDVRTGCE